MNLSFGKTVLTDIAECNSTIEFLYPKEENFYKSRCEDPYLRQILELNGHYPNKLTYRINNFGFRGRDFKEDTDCDVAIGSSNTWGGGNFEENLYHNLISQKTNRIMYNLGQPAGTCDGTYRLCEYWLPILKPKTVYAVWPHYERKELLLVKDRDDVQKIIPKHMSRGESLRKEQKWPESGRFYNTWFHTVQNSTLNSLRNLRAIQKLCDSIDAEFKAVRPRDFVYEDLSEELKQQPTYNVQGGPWPYTDIGRDFKHRGAHFHKLVADKLLNESCDPDIIAEDLIRLTY